MFYDRLLAEVDALNGIVSTAVISNFFITNYPERTITVEDKPGMVRLQFRSDEVSEGFFQTTATRLWKGRFFSAHDRTGAPRVVIINQAMAQQLWPGGDPLGKLLKLGPRDSGEPWFTVVGVVEDIRRQGPEIEPGPQMFEPIAQNPPRLGTLLIRTSANDPLTMVEAVKAAVRRVDPGTPVYGVHRLDHSLGAYLHQRRFQTALLIGFSVVALLLAGIGIYGVIQYSVEIRQREIGIRMALGAQRSDVFRMVTAEGLRLIMTGLALGIVGALWAGHAARSLLFGITATDPLTFAAVSFGMTAVAALACCFPAFRAMKVEPVTALRRE